MAALATVGGVKALVYAAVFNRAQEIAASDKLRSVVFEGEDLHKGTAECIGSSPSDIYQLSVSIDGAIAVGDCSCPAGKSAKSGLCKHAVALLLRRTQEVQGPKASPSGSSPEELVVSIGSQIDDFVLRQDVTKLADGEEAIQSSKLKHTDPPTSSSKRALPAWMLGVVGSAAAATPSSSKPKPNKRAAEPKPPRPPPPPARRARRSGQPLKIVNGSDEEEEDPGEVEDAAPTEKVPAPVAIEDDAVPESIDLPSEGAAARERRRLRALKKEVVVADEGGDGEVKQTRGRSRRATGKEVIDSPVRVAKRRRLAKKYAEEDSDVSENGAGAVDAEADHGFGLTTEDLLFFAREQLEKDKAAGQAEDVPSEAPRKQIEVGKPSEKSSQVKKSPTIFSMSKWKEMSSEGRGPGRSLSLAPDDVDWKTLTDSLGANSQKAAEDISPSLQVADPVTSAKDTPSPIKLETRSNDINAVANDMLDIFFGSTLSQVSAKDGPAGSSLPSTAEEDKPDHRAAVAGLEASRAPLSVLPEGVSVTEVVRNDLSDLGEGPKPKKKSSLKDRVKLLLS